MKKQKELQNTVIQYPFDDFTKAYTCRCGKTLRKSNLHNRVYVVSELDHDQIRHVKPHVCVKDRSKDKRK